MKLRTKLLIYFFAIITLAGGVYVLQHRTNEQVFQLYEDNLDLFLQLNQVSNQAHETYDSMHLYALESDRSQYLNYVSERERLEEMITWVNDLIDTLPYSFELENYRHMLISLNEELALAETGVVSNNVQTYSRHLNEAETIVQYIDEMTLTLIDHELNEYEEIFQLSDAKVTTVQQAGIALIVFVLSTGFLIAYWFTYRSTSTIEKMTESAKEIALGEFDGPDVKTKVKDELWFLSETFNDMKRNVQQNVAAIEEKSRLSRLLKEAELKSLQNQMNPHFLFNTLNTISRLAYIEGAKESSELMNSVSKLLRYNLRDIERPTTLGNELEAIQDYLLIQETRFGDRLSVQIDIDESCLDIPIPALTLQPLIENAFIHGTEGMVEGAKIVVSVEETDGDVYISVSDNGKGMSTDTIESVYQKAQEGAVTATEGKGHSTGIGLPNVMARLNHVMPDAYFEIKSTEGKGTVITIIIPKTIQDKESES
ncbi:HAMP domain-containing protein [Pelagirhabdus alkalitolerans]|uniref:histidine kinase n=1 Tax=Pelagirhabdus alkalitolerans TaxID=1612202 RepID=A0A1G6LE24_9BACI|nr:sensor histidine kinase [Pelagirhabdus alkalitolerans]SDC41443.1 HAMP domain-containing protein [Pelagirhabdus alkalitolerans]